MISKKTRKLLSALLLGVTFFTGMFVNHNKQEAQVGTHHSEETKRRIGDSNRKNTSCNKEVICIETDIVYPSTLEVQRQLGINHSSISRCCNNKQKVAGGFHWKYVSQN